MLLAPLVAVLAILALPVWPVAIVLVGAAFLVLWPVERLLGLLGTGLMSGWSAAVGRAFMLVLRPWRYFDPPRPAAAPEQQQTNPPQPDDGA
jgi:hypothetical protein